MILLMVRQSFTRSWRQKLLAVITIACGAMLAAAMLNLSYNVSDKVARELRTFGANITIKPRTAKILPAHVNSGFDPLTESSFLNESDLMKVKMIFWRNNILAFAPFLYDQGLIGPTSVPLIGSWFNKKVRLETGQELRTGIKETRPWVGIIGAWPADGSRSEVLIGSKLARKIGAKPGRRLSVGLRGKPVNLTIKGIITTGDQFDDSLVLPLSLLQHRSGLAGKINEAEVSALTIPENELARKYQRNRDSLTAAEWGRWYCTPYVDAIAFQVQEVIPNSTVKPFRQIAQSEGLVLNKIQLFMLLLTVAALIGSALGISSLMTAIVLERGREVGLAKALGATDGLVISIFLTEAALLGILGGLVGYGFGVGLAQAVAQAVFGSSLAIKALVFPVTVFISLLITLGGSLAAIKTIVRLSPKEVLHG